MTNENKKSLSNLSEHAVDGKNVKGGGFADGFSSGDEQGAPVDPFQAPSLVSAEDPMAGGVGPVGPGANGTEGENDGGPLGNNGHGIFGPK